ncbi:MAG: leucyl aminopeptidase family protein [Myxococcota bacterium]
MAMSKLHAVDKSALTESQWDAVVLVGSAFEFAGWPEVAQALAPLRSVDAHFGRGANLYRAEGLAGDRVVVSGTGPLDRDYDDPRRIYEAAQAGLQRAKEAGARRPLLVLETTVYPRGFEKALEVAVLGALAGLWVPLEAREAHGDAKTEPVTDVAFVYEGNDEGLVARLEAMEGGRRLARDLGGTEPERMAPIGFAEFCRRSLEPLGVEVTLKGNRDELLDQYPLMMSVARASMPVPRHHPRVIRLAWSSDDEPTKTLFLAGKAVTYDTGGADLKTGGHMAGMSRDKGGGAVVAGFMAAVAQLQPKNLRVVAEIGAVRNSIGAEALVSDEIITSHAGCRVRIGNTDAEGRLVLADLLSHLREEALGAQGARLFSVATLTGHSGRAVGPYSISLDNGPARAAGISESLGKAGDLWADPVELSRLRREDYDFVAPRSAADDVLSSNNGPSTQTARGHQFPMAFLLRASGLEPHGLQAETPLAYTHIDIGGSFAEGGDWQHGRPTAAPLLAMLGAFLEV